MHTSMIASASLRRLASSLTAATPSATLRTRALTDRTYRTSASNANRAVQPRRLIQTQPNLLIVPRTSARGLAGLPHHPHTHFRAFGTNPARRRGASNYYYAVGRPLVPFWAKLLLGAGVTVVGMALGVTVLFVAVPLTVLAVGGRRVGLGPLAWIDRTLGKAAKDLAANATAIQRLHYALTPKLRGSPTVLRTLGPGLELGIPLLTGASAVSIGINGVSAPFSSSATSIRFGAPLIHPHLGHRGLVLVDAIRRSPPSSSAGGSAASVRPVSEYLSSFSTAWDSSRGRGLGFVRSLRAAVRNALGTGVLNDVTTEELERLAVERAARRREKQRHRPRRNPAYSTEAEELADARDFFEDAREEVAAERRLRGGAAAGLEGDLEVVDAVLQLPTGEQISLQAELAGLVTDGPIIDAEVRSPSSGRHRDGEDCGAVIDVDFVERKSR